MNDPEFRKLMKKFFLAILITLIFMIPIFFFLHNKVLIHKSELLTDINKNKTVVIYITENNCKKCNNLKDRIKNINYKELNKDTNRDYEEIISKLGINESNISSPAILYVKKGQLISYIVDIKEDELKEFIKSYKLSK